MDGFIFALETNVLFCCPLPPNIIQEIPKFLFLIQDCAVAWIPICGTFPHKLPCLLLHIGQHIGVMVAKKEECLLHKICKCQQALTQMFDRKPAGYGQRNTLLQRLHHATVHTVMGVNPFPPAVLRFF